MGEGLWASRVIHFTKSHENTKTRKKQFLFRDFAISWLKAVSQRHLQMRIPTVLPQEVIAMTADADGGDRRPPMLPARLRVFDFRVLAAAVLPGGALEGDAPVRVNRVRGAADHRSGHPAIGRKRQYRSPLGDDLSRIAA